MNIVRHNIIYRPDDNEPSKVDYEPHLIGDDLHIYTHWSETTHGRLSMLDSYVSYFGDDLVRVSVSGWRRNGNRGIWAVYYWVWDGQSWQKRRRSHPDVTARLASGIR